MIDTQIKNSWDKILKEEFQKDYFIKLNKFLNEQLDQGKIIYPQGCDIFNAFRFTPPEKVKVILIGQDPYHGEGQAHGLCFSVLPDNKLPPSLKNIYKELNTDLGINPVDHGYLEKWAKQGVLMLNSVLTVEAKKPGSHRKKGPRCASQGRCDSSQRLDSGGGCGRGACSHGWPVPWHHGATRRGCRCKSPNAH